MTRTVVLGAGPVGLVTAVALRRRGHDVTVVDRDPGPGPDEEPMAWDRRGVMQFLHPHGFRPEVRAALEDLWPEALAALLAAGAEVRGVPGLPGAEGLHVRRAVFEATLRRTARTEPGLEWRTGHAEEVLVDGTGRVLGVAVGGQVLDADVVVVATGRASRLGERLRGPVEGGGCGFNYVSRMYRARPGQPGMDLPLPSERQHDGYLTVALPQDASTHSVLICCPVDSPALAAVKTNAGFAAAAAAVPNLATWVDPDRFEPFTDVLVGGGLTNTFRYQGPEPQQPPALGLFFVGDAVNTTNPSAGRGVALGLRVIREMLRLLDDPTVGLDDVSRGMDAFAERRVRPWYVDHARRDGALLRRYDGADPADDEHLPSDVISAAAEIDPSMMPVLGPYWGMLIEPDVMEAQLEAKARAVLATGWRPQWAPGPAALELSEIAGAAAVPTPVG